ncbi:hypothetical protein [Streptomyces uncialis]|uniref:Adenylate kinase n=1 Tax=Streptomyces uncialis TaxID=1048205 RepID=A0A1Q4UY87_9ACTN|nr:hypothetical protein [Streptomyces uncialis]OKH90469.1 hypothetical protein AB852_35470 [Streptomyces uncialis]
MRYPHIALIGRARSGKDTVAARLMWRYAYTRVAFADPLKSLALSIDPIVAYEPSGFEPLPTRLSAVVERYGWETAKDRFPEVRRALQRTGQALRDQDPDRWLSIALDKVSVADTWNLPVVVTDCRHPNEAEALSTRGFRLVRIVRPGVSDRPADHVSETALDGFPTDATMANAGTVEDLNTLADALI